MAADDEPRALLALAALAAALYAAAWLATGGPTNALEHAQDRAFELERDQQARPSTPPARLH